ncbi:bifunctional phosphoribosylaminoimidazolecarboxamide formyltransferase/IMP cyclohydrolase [Galbitalea soli]|uniref:Bifunctional purine biosynthesis protein PurH n=1 Tax=Galbitalea soli TaxID=1268042 RepID=A0A7C9PPB1_9MICO|nr:bifunctional phosphoribosylaminoimidazolecarboxamide formyltransferase/IMP cyclohydrolase [Galbitalea soli]NEM92232.1 bifunctional phosphoribosylaminoimidazolecarboxamide formyltransferase/IMP cyclohydrolase [Galbitalea soli]NYJ31814.1 phosphoribosylaminoimidazolecarboxamide formyltransferase/IMP cyclohydrolase [Galbitalea soli]
MSGPTHDPALYRHRDVVPIRRALVSVSDKTDLVELATALAAAGVEIVSTGSTAQRIAEAGIPVTEVAQVTGYPESLDGRVRTLHPAIHSGLLADLRLAAHESELAAQGIAPFELVVSNLYPFVETIASGVTGDAAIEQIDIGGPAMVRASAKNHANVAIVTSPASYPQIYKALTLGGTTLLQRQRLAAEAFAHTAAYDRAVADWFAAEVSPVRSATEADAAPAGFDVHAELSATLRYGENSHQFAALYLRSGGRGIAQATQLGGKEMSYNNYVDADAALRAAFDFDEPAVAIIKHANPCGIAVAATSAADAIASAHERAHACDPVSAYGGVIAANRVITLAAAQSIKPIFTEVVVAPGYEPEALALLQGKKNLRILQLPADFSRETVEFKQLSGGLLVQDVDAHFAPFDSWTLAAGPAADERTRADLEFAWRACRAVKSNAILLATDGASVGVGMGQVNRVDSCNLAVTRAGSRASGSVAASDAFFPFADGAEILLAAGVRAIVQPGGSIRDEEVVAAAEAAGVTMYFTGERHFFH